MDDLRARLGELACGRRLLDAAAAAAGVHLVGGAVRDLLLGRVPRELDVVVEGELEELAAALGGACAAHERFGTATVLRGECRWDLARSRTETYPRPGALPEVRAAAIDEDLARRDVTINAIALDLGDGRLRAVDHAFEDLQKRRLRVLHDASFSDDPTRLWRIARYAARLGFAPEPDTARLGAEAIAGGALASVSGARIGSELRLALDEPDPIGALESVIAIGLAPWLAPDRERAAAALEILPAGEGRRDLVVLATALCEGADDADRRLAALEFTRAERELLRAGVAAPELATAALAAERPSRLARVLRGQPIEVLALTAASGASAAVRRWLDDLRHVSLAIDGDDLIAAGVAQGPRIGQRLAAALDRRLDGELGDDRQAQLAAALEGS